MEKQLEQLNETMRDILQVLANLYVAVRCSQDKEMTERWAYEELVGDCLEGSIVQVCSKCARFDPEKYQCSLDHATFDKNGMVDRYRCPMFNPDPEK